MLKFKNLMNTNNKGVLLNLAKFIKEGFSRRTAIEFNTQKLIVGSVQYYYSCLYMVGKFNSVALSERNIIKC